VELLVALMVMALLSLMSWRGLDAMGRAQSQTQARSDDLQALRNGLAQWGADLDAMATEMSNPRAINTLPSPLEWNGQVFRITRYSSGVSDPALRVVAWTMGDDQGHKAWLRWQSPELRTPADLQKAWLQAATWAQSPNEASRARQTSIVPLVDWQIFYYRGDAWSNPGSSSEAAAINPDGVRLLLTLPAGQPLVGKITRDWIRPTAVGAKS
jgi:general secretion pathway protein J